jgi:hypothetical protein
MMLYNALAVILTTSAMVVENSAVIVQNEEKGQSAKTEWKFEFPVLKVGEFDLFRGQSLRETVRKVLRQNV